MSRRDMLGVWEVGYWPRVVLCRHDLGMIYEVTVQELIQHYSTRRICFRASTATRGVNGSWFDASIHISSIHHHHRIIATLISHADGRWGKRGLRSVPSCQSEARWTMGKASEVTAHVDL